MASSGKKYFKHQFDRIGKRAEKKAEVKLRESLDILLQMAFQELSGFRSLTGNLVNSLGVALYKDGKCLEAHGSIEITGKRPVRATLKNGEMFSEPFTYNGDILLNPIPKTDWVGTKNIWADVEVLKWLNRYPPRTKGFSYRIVSIVDYAKYLEAKGKVNVLSQLRDELAAMGGKISDLQF
jgi:hypothetical protein